MQESKQKVTKVVSHVKLVGNLPSISINHKYSDIGKSDGNSRILFSLFLHKIIGTV